MIVISSQKKEYQLIIFEYSFYNNNQMVLLQKLQKLILTFDMFCSSELLRYNQENQFKTFTGGILSLGIISVIIVAFASMIMDTLNKVAITSSLTRIKQTNPTPYTLIPNSQNNFMFAVGMNSMDLALTYNISSTPRFFDVEMRTISFLDLAGISATTIPMIPCTKQHWKMIPALYEKFDESGGSVWLCPPIDYPINLTGSYFSHQYNLAQITVSVCKNKTANDTCAPQYQIDYLNNLFHNFQISIIYSNPVINPNKPDYISYYLEQNAYVLFSKTIGAQSWVQFSDYTIQTDDSILPFTNIVTQKGVIVQDKLINFPFAAVNDGLLASIFLTKSPNSLVYNRQVQKISAVFSYIGGLVGAVTACLFLIKSYTDSSLEITLGLFLFQDGQDAENSEKQTQFNMFGYIRLVAYRMLRLCKWTGEWKIPEKLDKYQEEAVKQLDVRLLLKRLIMLQTCMNRLIPKKQLQRLKEGIEQQGHITLRSAKQMRTLLIKAQKEKDTLQVQQYKDSNFQKQSQMMSPQGQQSTWFNILINKQKKQILNHNLFPNNQKSMGSKFKAKENERSLGKNQTAIKLNHNLYQIQKGQQILIENKAQPIVQRNLQMQKDSPRT